MWLPRVYRSLFTSQSVPRQEVGKGVKVWEVFALARRGVDGGNTAVDGSEKDWVRLTKDNHFVSSRKVQTRSPSQGRNEEDENVRVLVEFVNQGHSYKSCREAGEMVELLSERGGRTGK